METRISIEVFLFFWIIALIILLYTIYYQIFKNSGFSERVYIFKVSIYMLVLLIVLWKFIDNTIKIYIVSGNYLIGLFWMLLVSLIIYMYINICGFIHIRTKNYQAIIYLAILLYFSLSGFGYLGIKIFIDSEYLFYKTFQTNDKIGIFFMLYNLSFMLLLFFLSILIEREI